MLAAAVWGGKHGDQADCWVIQRLYGQRSPTLFVLQGNDVGVPHPPQQVPWGKASQRGGDVELDVGKVIAGGDGVGFQGCLRYVATLPWTGGRDQRGDSHGAAPVAAACLGVVLGVSPY